MKIGGSLSLNLRQIEVFRAVMVTGSMSDAARLLHVSQPGVSRLISHLELRLQVPLFERRKRRLVATPEAITLHDEIERIYRGVTHVNEVAEQLKFGGQGSLRVLSSANTALRLVPRAISRVLAGYPGARFAFEAVTTPEIIRRLVAEEADIAVCSAPVEHPSLVVKVIGSWRLLCVIGQAHALAKGKTLRLREALAERLVAYSHDAPQSKVIDGWLEEHAIPRNVVVEVRSAYVACSLVAAGVGVAFVDDLSARAHGSQNVVFKKVPIAPEFPISILWNTNRPLSQLGRKFVDAASAELAASQKPAM